jgi:hypothetical protein
MCWVLEIRASIENLSLFLLAVSSNIISLVLFNMAPYQVYTQQSLLSEEGLGSSAPVMAPSFIHRL